MCSEGGPHNVHVLNSGVPVGGVEASVNEYGVAGEIFPGPDPELVDHIDLVCTRTACKHGRVILIQSITVAERD